jgi:hypothetical protein
MLPFMDDPAVCRPRSSLTVAGFQLDRAELFSATGNDDEDLSEQLGLIDHDVMIAIHRKGAPRIRLACSRSSLNVAL